MAGEMETWSLAKDRDQSCFNVSEGRCENHDTINFCFACWFYSYDELLWIVIYFILDLLMRFDKRIKKEKKQEERIQRIVK